MLNDFWRDVIALGSLGLTACGFYYAIVQIRKTKSAAKAAEEAAERVLAETRQGFQKYSAAFGHRYINEAKIHIQNEAWEKAAFRLNDLADHLGFFSTTDQQWVTLVETIRKWSATCNRRLTGKIKTFDTRKWTSFCVSLEARLDMLLGPTFTRSEEASNDS